jgi:hypothetical protein
MAKTALFHLILVILKPVHIIPMAKKALPVLLNVNLLLIFIFHA